MKAFIISVGTSAASARSIGWKVDYGAAMINGVTNIGVIATEGSVKEDVRTHFFLVKKY